MTRFILSIVLCCVALPAFGQEAPRKFEVEITGVAPGQQPPAINVMPAVPPDVAAAQVAQINAEIEAGKALTAAQLAKTQAEIEQLHDETSNGSVIGRASMSAEKLCGLQFDKEATGRRGVQLAELYAECVLAEVELERVKNQGLLVKAVAEGKQDLAPLTVTNTGVSTEPLAGVVLAASAGTGTQQMGFGYGTPLGASPFTNLQTNAVGWQAVAAGQSAVPVRPTANQTVVKQTVVVPPAPPELTEEQRDAQKRAEALRAAGIR